MLEFRHESTKKAPKSPLGLLYCRLEAVLSLLLDSELATVVATLTTDGVVDVPCSAVSALC